MAKKFKGFTMEEHQATGSDLQKMHAEFRKIQVQIQEKYGVSSKESAALARFFPAFLELKNVMDYAYFRDVNPTNREESPYYHWNEKSNQGEE